MKAEATLAAAQQRNGDHNGVAHPDSDLDSEPETEANALEEGLLGKGATAKDRYDAKVVYEFGGPWGVLMIMIISHILLYYFYLGQDSADGTALPRSWSDMGHWFRRGWHLLVERATPTWKAAGIYSCFLGLETFFSLLAPGIVVNGLPVPSEGNKSLPYLCNALWCWYLTLGLVATLHFTKVFPLYEVAENFGAIMTVSVLVANGVTLFVYFGAVVKGCTHRMSGSFIYDLFMGAWLNPRTANIDWKMWAEIKVSWITLFLLTLSAAALQYKEKGHISVAMWFMILAHFLYSNACMKGEECVPTTWDIFYEKWGWMLIFWNLAGVPFLYCFQSFFVYYQDIKNPIWLQVLLFFSLLGAYYTWDTANSQKNRFRMQWRGVEIKRRWAFPQLPWGTLKDPKYIATAAGSPLLCSGWYGLARKVHYTADIVMALSWGLNCGFSSFLPYFYVCFFTLMITHRCVRDQARCKDKYGKDWEDYTTRVPYLLIPFVI